MLAIAVLQGKDHGPKEQVTGYPGVGYHHQAGDAGEVQGEGA